MKKFRTPILAAAAWALLALPAAASSSYDGALQGLIDAMLSGLSGKGIQRIAVAGFHEQSTGGRSPFCARIESDLTSKLQTQTSFFVPDTARVAARFKEAGIPEGSLGSAEALYQVGKDLEVQAFLTGSYLPGEAGSVRLLAGLINRNTGEEIWKKEFDVPVGDLPENVLNLPNQAAPNASAQPATPSVQVSKAFFDWGFTPAWNRAQVGLGYERLVSEDATFAGNVGGVNGVYGGLRFGGLFTLGFDYWNAPSVSLSNFNGAKELDVNGLNGLALDVGLSYPIRVGPSLSLWAGLGGRFENLTVSSPGISAQYPVSFGNNSFSWNLGGRYSWGAWGADLALSQDFPLQSTYNPSLGIRLGVSYEFALPTPGPDSGTSHPRPNDGGFGAGGLNPGGMHGSY